MVRSIAKLETFFLLFFKGYLLSALLKNKTHLDSRIGNCISYYGIKLCLDLDKYLLLLPQGLLPQLIIHCCIERIEFILNTRLLILNTGQRIHFSSQGQWSISLFFVTSRTLSSECFTSPPRQKIQCMLCDVTIAWFCKGSK